MPESPLTGRRIAQVAIVVRDIAEASRRYADIFGLPVPEPIVTQPGLEVRMTYRGQLSDARAKLAFFDFGNLQLELIEPMGGDSVWQRHLDERGEGVQHIAFWVEGMGRVAEFLADHGIPMAQRGDMGAGQYAYFDAEDRLGITLELLERVREPSECA